MADRTVPHLRRRFKTYIEGFDEQIEGGIPQGQVVLIAGTPGTMKSSFAFHVLYYNALNDGVKGVYMSMEQSRDSLLEHMACLGMDIEKVEDKLVVLDLGLMRKKLDKLSAKVAWPYVFKMLAENYKDYMGHELLVLDSLDVLEIISRFDNPRNDLFFFFEWLRGLDITTLLVSEMSPDSNFFAKYDADFLADGIIHLKMERMFRDEVSVQRRVRCVKMRSTNHNTSYFILLHNGEKFQVTQLISES